MDKDLEEIVKRVAVGATIGLLGASIRAFLEKNETLWTKTKVFLAGVFFALLCSMILVYSNASPMFQNIICGAAGAFVSTLWPIIERGVGNLTALFFKKKAKELDDVVHIDRDKHTGGPDRNFDPSQYR